MPQVTTRRPGVSAAARARCDVPEASGKEPELLGDPEDSDAQEWFFTIPPPARRALAGLATCDDAVLDEVRRQMVEEHWPEGMAPDTFAQLARLIGRLATEAETEEGRTLMTWTSL